MIGFASGPMGPEANNLNLYRGMFIDVCRALE